MDNLFSALQKKHIIENNAIKRYEVIYNYKDKIRKCLDINRINILNRSVSFAGIDSSYEILTNYLNNVEYICVGVANWFNNESYLSEYNQEDSVLYEVETGEYDVFLKGLSIFMETEMTEKMSNCFAYVFMDRSVISLIAGINQSVSVANRIQKSCKLATKLVNDYTKTIDKLYSVINSGNVIMSMKRSSREELKDHLSRYFGHIQSNDYEILFTVLEVGEYIILPMSNKYTFNLPQMQKMKLINEIFQKIAKGFVIYVKGLNGKIFKFEYFGETITDDMMEILFMQTCTADNEILILQECDRSAKRFLRFFKEKSIIEKYRK